MSEEMKAGARGHSAGHVSETKRYDVLRIDPSHGPLYLLVPALYAEGEDADNEHAEFAYEEHTCPSDILARCEDVIAGGDTDPHHIIDYVRTIDVTWNYPCDPADVLRPLIPEAFASRTPSANREVVERVAMAIMEAQPYNLSPDEAMNCAQAAPALTDVEITSAMVSKGVRVLRRAFGGETEGANRFVDFSETVEAILAAALGRRGPPSV